MINGVFFMADWGFYGGTIGNILADWESAGVFSYLLPFLIIFALITAILGQIKVFEKNKAVNVVIALAVSLMALQFDFVPRFFTEVFPRVGIGLAIILIALIFLGLFRSKQNSTLNWILFGIAAIVLIVVLINTSNELGWSTGDFITRNWESLVGIVAFFVVLGAIIGGLNKKSKNNDGKGFHIALDE